MWKVLNFRCGVVWAAFFCLFIAVTLASAQDSKVLGEVSGLTSSPADIRDCISAGRYDVWHVQKTHDHEARRARTKDFPGGSGFRGIRRDVP